MQRIHVIGSSLLLAIFALIGCGQNPPLHSAPASDAPVVVARAAAQDQPPGEPPQLPDLKPLFVADEKQEKYENALSEALTFMADRKYSQALVALESAREFQDNDFVRGEIEKLKQRLNQENAAQTTLASIERVLEEGKAEEAAKLSRQALQEFGDREGAEKLIRLRLQADALQTVQAQEDNATRFARLRDEGEQALQEKNLRAAAIAFEQATQIQPDPGLQRKLTDVRGNLERYDANRKKAHELRRDPNQLDEAIDALKEASTAWDTLQIRQEIDEFTLALQKRRDTVSVADFETRGDIGQPMIGRSIAEELLPMLKMKFDLVERGSLNQVIQELKLESSFQDNADEQLELGRLAKVRYLVLGSVSRIGSVNINARLVDVRTGLVVQTAKISAPTPDEVFAQIPELAKQLMMTDEQKIAYDQERQQIVQRPPVVQQADPLPPPPEPVIKANLVEQPMVQQAAPIPEMLGAPPPPPVIGDVNGDMFRRLPPPPPAGEVMILPPGGATEFALRQRMFAVALMFGDDLFRVGRFRDAFRHYDFAHTLFPGHPEILIRLERTRPFVPPPPVVIVDPIVVVRPRLAILNFAIIGDPRFVPPYLSSWIPSHLEPYLRAHYDIVDSHELYWYMARLGMTIHDVLNDPYARRWLGRAIGTRFFLMGNAIHTASFDVNTFIVDAEFGHVQNSGRIHVHNTFELKMRMAELAQITVMPPGQRVLFVQEQPRFDAIFVQGRDCMNRRDWQIAINHFENCLKIRPNHVECRVYLQRCRQAMVEVNIASNRNSFFLQFQTSFTNSGRRQWELAQNAELARVSAIQQGALMDETLRRRQYEERMRAQLVVVEQARFAFRTRNFGLSISKFETALQMIPAQPPAFAQPLPFALPAQDDLARELATARREVEKEEQLRLAQVRAEREAAARQVREQQLLAARQKLLDEQARAKIDADRLRKEREQRDQDNYTAALREGQRLLSTGNFDGAISSLLAAQRIRRSDAAENLLDLAYQRRAEAQAKTVAEKQAIEQQLLAERERRKSAENLAKVNENKYKSALVLAQNALADREFDVAQAKFEEAGKIYRTDVVLAGLKQVETGRRSLVIAKQKQDAEAQKANQIQTLLTKGQGELSANNFTAAFTNFQSAKKLAPDNLEVLTGLTRAEQGRDRLLAEARRKSDELNRKEEFRRLFEAGQNNLNAKNYDAAVASLSEAVRLNPTDAGAINLLKQAEKSRSTSIADGKTSEELKKKTQEYQRFVNEGRLALNSKRYEDAIGAFTKAQTLLPGDAASKQYLADAQKGKLDLAAAALAESKRRAAELKTSNDIQKALGDARLALTKKDLSAAEAALSTAQKLGPNNAEVTRALRDLSAAQAQANAEAEAKKKREGEFNQLILAGRQAMSAKNYDAAVKSFTSANTLFPYSKIARDELAAAQTAVKTAQTSQMTTQKIQQAVAAGQKAMTEKDYDDAVKFFSDASKLDPTDVRVKNLLQQAQKSLSDENQAKQVTLQKQTAYLQNLEAGQRAMNTKNYALAIKSINEALKNRPNDPAATRMLQQAQSAMSALDREADELKNKQQRFQTLIKTGQSQLATKKFAEAIKTFSEASQLNPGDAQAKSLLQQARVGYQDAQEDLEIARLLQTGRLAMAGKRYQEAGVAFRNILKLEPQNADALRGLREIQQALDSPQNPNLPKVDTKKPNVPMPNPNPAGGNDAKFRESLQRGLQLEQQGNFPEALKFYEEALRFKPNDPQALEGKKKGQFNVLVQSGNRNMEARRYMDAVRDFDEALRIFPFSTIAKNLRDKAKKASMMK